MRGIGGRPGWFYLFLLEGLLTFIIGLASFLYLPQSPVSTKNVLSRNPWYSSREESIMVNRLLRDDPAKGITAIKEPATLKDIRDAWSDNSMWGLYFLGLVFDPCLISDFRNYNCIANLFLRWLTYPLHPYRFVSQKNSVHVDTKLLRHI